jgi:transposase
MEARLVQRAKIILKCLEGKPHRQIARELEIRPNTVSDWRRRFESEGIGRFSDRPRSGKPVEYGEKFRNNVLSLLEKAPLMA